MPRTTREEIEPSQRSFRDFAVRYRGRPRGHPPATRELARCPCTETPWIVARRCTFRGGRLAFLRVGGSFRRW